MKKFSVILLIAVLAMTSVFADPITVDAKISGKAVASYDVYLDKSLEEDAVYVGSFDYTTPDATGLKATVTLTGAAGKKDHATDLWAEMAATITYKAVPTTTDTTAVTLSTFAIHKDGKWDWDLLKAAKVADLAKSFDVTYDGTKASAAAVLPTVTTGNLDNNTEINGKGTTFTWNGFTFAAAVNGGIKREVKQDYYFGVKTPFFTLGTTGLKIQGAGAFKYSYTPAVVAGTQPVTGKAVYIAADAAADAVENGTVAVGSVFSIDSTVITGGDGKTTYLCNGGSWIPVKKVSNYRAIITAADAKGESDAWNIEGSLAIAYANDEETIKVSAATDQKLTFGKLVDKEKLGLESDQKVKYDVDALVNLTFKPATIDIYYANNASVALVDYTKTTKPTTSIKNLFSVKASADLKAVAPVAINLKGLNLLNASRILSADVTYTFVEDKFDITAYAYDLLNHEAITDKVLDQEDAIEDADERFYRANGEGQKVGLKSTMTFGDVVIAPEVYYRIAYKEFKAGVDVTYTNPMFTVTSGINSNVIVGADANTKSNFMINAGIETDKLVENATLAFNYASNNLLKNSTYVDPKMSISYGAAMAEALGPYNGAGVASFTCTVEF